MKRVFLLLSLLFGLAPALPAGAENGAASSVMDHKPYTLTPIEFGTLEIFDMDGHPVKDYRTQRTMDARKDEFLGLYVKVSSKLSYYVVRPLGGKPIKSISWKDYSVGGKRSMLLNGRTVSEYFRDEQKNARQAEKEMREQDRQALQAVKEANRQMIEAWQQAAREARAGVRSGPVGSSLAAPLAKADAMSLFTKWSVKEGVSATYISQAMFRMIGKIPQIELNRPVDLTPVIQTLGGLYMLEFAKEGETRNFVGTSVTQTRRYERNTQLGGLRMDIQDYLSGNGYALLMEKREGELVTRLFVAGDGKTVRGFVLVRMDVDYDYGQFVCIEGEIPQDKFEALIANGMK